MKYKQHWFYFETFQFISHKNVEINQIHIPEIIGTDIYYEQQQLKCNLYKTCFCVKCYVRFERNNKPNIIYGQI